MSIYNWPNNNPMMDIVLGPGPSVSSIVLGPCPDVVLDKSDMAPEGQVYVCVLCGNVSKDRKGEHRISTDWKESCALCSELCYQDRIVISGGTVVEVKSGGFVE